MKIERIRKSHKKEIIIGAVVTLGIVGALTFVGTRAKYKTTEILEHVITGTIKYTPYDFKIMAMYKSEDGETYTEITERMPSSEYVINESKSYCTMDNKTHDTEAVLKTIDGNHVISNLTKSDKCYLYFDKKNTDIVTVAFGDIEVKRGKPDFANAATTDEGIYAEEDGMYGGTSYYWRGAVTNNYVKFANKCWRMVRINGDGTLRLIYDGTTCHANGESTTNSIAVTDQKYNLTDGRSEYVGYTYTLGSQRTISGTASNLKSQTDTWYNNNIGNNTTYASKVADGKYCNDRNTASGYSWISQGSAFFYAGLNRSGATPAPTLSCPSGDVYILKAGAITMDEVIMAGSGKPMYLTVNYYLNNGQYYWTMSPYRLNSSDGAGVYMVANTGRLSSVDINNAAYGVRPVINLKANIQFKSGGTGTQSNPYVVQ